MRWGPPSSQKALFDAAARRADKQRAKWEDVDFDALLKMEPDSGTTNVRNIFNGTRWNAYWNRWMGSSVNAVGAPIACANVDRRSSLASFTEVSAFVPIRSRPLCSASG